MNSTADHGVESLRMTGNAVRKTESAVRTAKAAMKAPKQFYRAAEGTVKTTYKITKATAHVTAAVISHTVAFLFNPIVLGFILIVVVILMCAALITQAVGTDQAEETQVFGGAYIEMIGVGDIAARYPDAAEYFRIACDENRAAYNALIDNLHYNYSDLEHSDLVYMERNDCGAVTVYQKGYASDAYKAVLKAGWTMPLTEQQAIAIAYVYLEKQENDVNGTEMDIYNVTFTQDVFRSIVNTAVSWSQRSYANQRCPDGNCSAEEIPNPAFAAAQTEYNHAENRYNDWCINVVPAANAYRNLLNTYNATPAAGRSVIQPALDAAWARLNEAVNNWYYVFGNRGWTINADIGDNARAWLGAEVDAARNRMNSTPQTITNPSAVCRSHHTLWSFGLYAYPADTVMNTLDFNEKYKNWESMTEYGMETNPGI